MKRAPTSAAGAAASNRQRQQQQRRQPKKSKKQKRAAHQHQCRVDAVRRGLVYALKNHSSDDYSYILSIIEKCPEAIAQNDSQQRTVLLEALRYDASIAVVKCLVQHRPQLLLERDNRGNLPLHEALENNAGDDIIFYLVQECPPPTIYATNHCSQHRPVRMAIEHGTSLAVVQLLDPTEVHVSKDDKLVHLALWSYARRRRRRRNNANAATATAASSSSTASDVDLIRYLIEKRPCGATVGADEEWFGDAAEAGAPPDVLAFLLELHPNALTQASSRTGNLPVHSTAASSTTSWGFAAFKFVVNVWPESLQHVNKAGDLPLHIAIREGCSAYQRHQPTYVPAVERIHYILQKWPPAVRIKGGTYNPVLPLHMALYAGLPNEALAQLLDAWPESIHELSSDTNEPILHFLLRTDDVSLDTAMFLVRRDETIVDAQSPKDGSLAVHAFAAALGCGRDWDATALDFVRYLLRVRPRSIVARDRYGCLPVHRAFIHPYQDVRIAEYLLNQAPDTIASKNNKGKNLLHISIASVFKLLTRHERHDGDPFDGVSDKVRYLVEQGPELLRDGDLDGNLPVHDAICQKSWIPELIRYLSHQDPDTLMVRNRMGLSPLHLVVMATPKCPFGRDNMHIELRHEAMARILVEHRPDALGVGNADGLLPLHLAAGYGDARLPLVELLVDVRPDTATIPARDGRLALHCCAAGAAAAAGAGGATSALGVATCLVAVHPEAVTLAAADGRLPLHYALAGDCASTTAITVDSYVNDEDKDDYDYYYEYDDEKEKNVDDKEQVLALLLPLVKLLVQAAPPSLQVRDGAGNIPLQLAAANPSTPIDVLWFLMTECPSSVSTLRTAMLQ